MTGNQLITTIIDGIFNAVMAKDWLMIAVYGLALISILVIIGGILYLIVRIIRGIFARIAYAMAAPKAKASRIKCRHCGRTLEHCVCVSNKYLSYRQRIKKHNRELKLLHIKNKKGR